MLRFCFGSGVVLSALAIVVTIGTADDKKAPIDVRFDEKVRVEIFKGLKGDREALDRGMKICADELKVNPDNPYAMVWHGTGRIQLAQIAFRKKEMADGQKEFLAGIKELDRAVELAPKSIGTRVPRAIVYTQMFPFVPVEPVKKDLIKKAKEDLEFLETTHTEAKDWDKIGNHRRGELYLALAMLNRHTGNEEKAKGYLETLVVKNKGSKYESIASEWLKDPTKKTHNCIGCHTPE
jgi:hypothetical protein